MIRGLRSVGMQMCERLVFSLASWTCTSQAAGGFGWDLHRPCVIGDSQLPGVFMGYALYAGGSWKGDVFVADAEELQENDASDVYSIRMNTRQVPMCIQ